MYFCNEVETLVSAVESAGSTIQVAGRKSCYTALKRSRMSHPIFTYTFLMH